MCRPHWFGLPVALRDEVWRSWRLAEGHRRADMTPEEKLADIHAYRTACTAAIEHWRGQS